MIDGMKKIVSFLFLCVLMACSVRVEEKNNKLFALFQQGMCEFFVPSAQNQTIPTCASVITSGNHFFVRVDLSLATFVQSQLNSIEGVTVIGAQNEQSVLTALKAKVCKRQQILGKEHIFAFSPYFDAFIVTNGKKTNVHLVVDATQIFVGVPIVYGSY